MEINIRIQRSELTNRRAQSLVSRNLVLALCESAGITAPLELLRGDGLTLINYIRSFHRASLSIAHCRGMCAASLCLGDFDTGIDCEPSDQERDWSSIAESFYLATEHAEIAQISGDQKGVKFLHYWVLKEAYVKAIRGSIFGDLNRLDASLLTEPHPVQEASECWAWAATVGKFHFGLCALDCPRPTINLKELYPNPDSPLKLDCRLLTC